MAQIVSVLSGIVLVGFCVLSGLAIVVGIRPLLAERFLGSFASSGPTHYTEQGLRLLVGTAMVNFAHSMWYPELFALFGWLIVVSTIALLLVPWRWHQRLGMRVIPLTIRHMRMYALGAVALAAFILYGMSRAALP